MLKRISQFITYFSTIRFVQQVIVSGASYFILSVCGLIVNIVIANFYSADGLGYFQQVMSIYLIASTIASMGINSSLIKHAAENKDNQSQLQQCVSASVLLTIASSSVLLLLLYLTVWIFPNLKTGIINGFIGISWGLPLFALNRTLLGLLNGLRKMNLFSFAQSLRWILILLFIVIGIRLNLPVKKIILVFPCAEVMLTLLLVSVNLKNFSFFPPFSQMWVNVHFNYGIKTLLTNLAGEFNDKIDILVIGSIMGNSAAGIYSFTINVAKGLLVFSSIIQLNFSPLIAEYWSKRLFNELNGLIRIIFKYNLLIYFIVIIVAFFVYPLLLDLFITDPAILQSTSIFNILLLGVFFSSVFLFMGGFLTMSGFPTAQLIYMTIVVISGLGFIIAGASFFNLYGVALAFLLNGIFTNVLLKFFIRKYTGIDIFQIVLQKS